jgi:hypothetical protein
MPALMPPTSSQADSGGELGRGEQTDDRAHRIANEVPGGHVEQRYDAEQVIGHPLLAVACCVERLPGPAVTAGHRPPLRTPRGGETGIHAGDHPVGHGFGPEAVLQHDRHQVNADNVLRSPALIGKSSCHRPRRGCQSQSQPRLPRSLSNSHSSGLKKLGNVPDGGGWRYLGRAEGKKNRHTTSGAARNRHHQPVMGTAFVHTVIDEWSKLQLRHPRRPDVALSRHLLQA